MARDTNQIMGHAEDNDGIEEYDNPLPDWWVGLFLFTIVFGIGYAIYYHFVAHDSQEKAYVAEMAAAAKQWPPPKGGELAELSAANLGAGEELFKANCAPCHLADLTGSAGPNLIDGTWIHGGTQEEIQLTITQGVKGTAMPEWGPKIGPDKVGKVAAYVYSKGERLGVRVPAGKTAGEPVKPGGAAAPATPAAPAPPATP